MQHAGLLVDDAGHHHSAGDRGQASERARRRQLLGRAQDVREDGIGALLAPGGAAQRVAELTGLVDQGALDAGAADIDSDRYSGHLRT